MADQEQTTDKGYGKGYGKRPMWQWVLIYLIVGGLIYYAVYYFAFANKGGYSNNSSTPTEKSSPY